MAILEKAPARPAATGLIHGPDGTGMLMDMRTRVAIRDPAIILQPYQGLLAGFGEKRDMSAKYDMLRSVDPETIYILVPLAVGHEHGLSASQACFLINLLDGPDGQDFMAEFHEHLCLDDDVRRWIDSVQARIQGTNRTNDETEE